VTTTSPPLNILLVLPQWRMTSNRWKLSDHPYVQKKAFVAPLSLATLAALTPAQHHTDIWDEAVHGEIDDDTVFERRRRRWLHHVDLPRPAGRSGLSRPRRPGRRRRRRSDVLARALRAGLRRPRPR
jgi:hypothetical protein